MRKFAMGAMILGLAGSNAFASLVLVGSNTTPSIDINGTGLGAVNTVLTVQSPANSSTESGCVAPGPGTTSVTTNCGFTNSTVLTGNSQIGTPTFSSVGISNGGNIGIVLNSAEPGNASSITVSSLVLTLYGTGGATQTHTLAAPVTLQATANGTGNSGYLFALTQTEADEATSFLSSNTGARIGLGASLDNATGGNETFFLFNRNLQGEAPGVPEPTSLALLGLGLAGLGLYRKRAQ